MPIAEGGDGPTTVLKNPRRQDRHWRCYARKRHVVKGIRDSLSANPGIESLTKCNNRQHEKLSHDVHY